LIPTIRVRVSPHGYFTVIVLSTFVSGLLFYLEMDIAAIVVFAISWIALPFLAFNDHIQFDGRRLARTGLVPRIWSRFTMARRRLRLTDIEQVETNAIRTLKRAGNAHYRYRTVIRGRDVTISITSGGESYRQMIKAVLPKLEPSILDVRSLELRDHLTDPKETLTRAEFARIPSTEVLRESFRMRPARSTATQVRSLPSEDAAGDLQSLGNELRLAGFLVRAAEALRRALILKPGDARVLLDLARCLHSLGGVEKNPRLKRRAIAALRLSEKSAGEDADLLARIGEVYFQFGSIGRASKAFEAVSERLGTSFRAAAGLAELALRDGKIAHVIHHFNGAHNAAPTPAQRRWSAAEADYFSHLHQDDEYMEMEIARVSLLDTVESLQSASIKIVVLACPALMIGLIFEDGLVANIGWAVSGLGLVFWSGLSIVRRSLSRRIPYDLMSE
jgi:tetratricopeptide (TPR) repeat protein